MHARPFNICPHNVKTKNVAFGDYGETINLNASIYTMTNISYTFLESLDLKDQHRILYL